MDVIKDICPNCENPNKEIKLMPNGSCGVCAGKGFILWKEIGKLEYINKED